MEEQILEVSKAQEIRNLAEALKRLEVSEEWNKLVAHLHQHLTRREQVKADQIRKSEDARYSQGFIDGINFVMSEPSKLIKTAFNSSKSETEV